MITSFFTFAIPAPNLSRAMRHARAVTLALAMGAAGVSSAVPLDNQPVLAGRAVPGNLALALSVEWPTAMTAAYKTTTYSATNSTTRGTADDFLGYFDPKKCYTYTTSNGGHFVPSRLTTNRLCNGSSEWSGDYLNWATMQVIDPFRWVLTGGSRDVDTSSMTILRKAYSSSSVESGFDGADTGVFPRKKTNISGSTPFGTRFVSTGIARRGTEMYFRVHASDGNNPVTAGSSTTAYTGGALADTPTTRGATYRLNVGVRVCVAGLLEANCKPYPNATSPTVYKPEGLMQQYADRMRYSVFGYLSIPARETPSTDGGVLRARQKFIGPTKPSTSGALSVTNPVAEWDATTGVMLTNPDSTDAATPVSAVAATQSGAMNYLNKFGYALQGYDQDDAVSELYYAIYRYLKGLGNIGAWTSGATSANADGFPVINNWGNADTSKYDSGLLGSGDPVLYTCQRNFILGVGDIRSHYDKNLPGRPSGANSGEPTLPTFTNETVDSYAVTRQLFNVEGFASSTSIFSNTSNAGYLSGAGGDRNSALIAGLAYDARVRGVRTHNGIPQTVETFWVDVLEQGYVRNNQYYLATKYGGLTIPQGTNYALGDPLGANTWWTDGDTVDADTSATKQLRPRNYFTGGTPADMRDGLTNAFRRIADSIQEFTTSFSLSTPQIQSSGAASFATQYDTADWTSVITGSTLSFVNAQGAPDPMGEPRVVTPPRWNTTTTLAAQFAGTGWNTGRKVATWNNGGVPFRRGNLNTTQQGALSNTSHATAATAETNLVNYLRGDRSNEITALAATKPFRQRSKLLGDIVNAKLQPVGPPNRTYSDALNPGYAAFKVAKKDRTTVIYAGANDGMLHAINGNLDTANGGGQEMFAYVPSALFNGPSSPATPKVDGLAALANPSYEHRFYVDSTPRAFDVDFNRYRANSGAAWRGGASYAPDWRTILIGGLGKGGRSYYALDVTNPASNTETNASSWVLWEFSDADMGYSYGEPLLIKTSRHGWVVVLTSGYHNDNTDRQGYFYIIDPKTGDLMQKIGTGSGTTANGLAHAEAYVKDYADGTVDAVYAGDLNGQLWRLDLSAETGTGYPSPVQLAVLTNAAGTAQPITTRPLIEIHPQTLKRYVLVGTGKLLDGTDVASTSLQGFYGIVDGGPLAFEPHNSATMPYLRANFRQRGANAFAAGVTLSGNDRGWYIDLGLSNGVAPWVVSPSTSFNGRLAFSALLPAGDVCSPQGTSQIYALDFAGGRSVRKSSAANSNTIVAFIAADAAITDLRFISVDGTTKLLAGDNKAKVEEKKLEPAPRPPVRLLNWREIPTAD